LPAGTPPRMTCRIPGCSPGARRRRGRVRLGLVGIHGHLEAAVIGDEKTRAADIDVMARLWTARIPRTEPRIFSGVGPRSVGHSSSSSRQSIRIKSSGSGSPWRRQTSRTTGSVHITFSGQGRCSEYIWMVRCTCSQSAEVLGVFPWALIPASIRPSSGGTLCVLTYSARPDGGR
jgi:hypothetical protein